jgi:hypothetical protein
LYYPTTVTSVRRCLTVIDTFRTSELRDLQKRCCFIPASPRSSLTGRG